MKLIKNKDCENCKNFMGCFHLDEHSVKYECRLDYEKDSESYEEKKCPRFRAEETQSILTDDKIKRRILEEL